MTAPGTLDAVSEAMAAEILTAPDKELAAYDMSQASARVRATIITVGIPVTPDDFARMVWDEYLRAKDKTDA